jgi:hypothetical protein
VPSYARAGVSRVTADDKKYVHAYDYMGRRVRKAVYAWDPNAADWSATAELDLRFMHHERKLLLELDGLDSLAKLRKYVWGPDPGSGRAPYRPNGRDASLDRLLAVGDVSGSTDYVCFTNAGGSVVQLLDRSDGSIDAKYVYDDPLRYHALYFDKELDYADTACDGLYCTPIGNYYSPRLGRAVTRGGGGRVPGGFAGNVGGALPYGDDQFSMPLIGGGGDVYVSPGCGEGGCAHIGDPQDPCENPQTAEDCERCNPPCPGGFEYAGVNGECLCGSSGIELYAGGQVAPGHPRPKEDPCERGLEEGLQRCLQATVECLHLCHALCEVAGVDISVCQPVCSTLCQLLVLHPCLERVENCYQACQELGYWPKECP